MGRIEVAGAKALSEREAVPLGPEIIHSVINPVTRLTGPVHVYGGTFLRFPTVNGTAEHLEQAVGAL